MTSSHFLSTQFVGADTAENAIPLLRALRAANRGVVFTYSVEVKESDATSTAVSSSPTTVDGKPPHKRIVDEILHSIDVAADFELGLEAENASSSVRADNAASASVRRSGTGRRTWVAFKMSALLPDAHALIAWSSHITASRKSLPSSSIEATVPFPGAARMEDMDIILRSSSPLPSPTSYSPSSTSNPLLTLAQIHHLCDLYADLVSICAHANEKGVKVIVDAEHRYLAFQLTYLKMLTYNGLRVSWYQPAIDALTLSLMREFNSLDPNQSTEGGSGKIQPLVYGTFQAYLRR